MGKTRSGGCVKNSITTLADYLMDQKQDIQQITVQAPRDLGAIRLSYQVFGQDLHSHPVVMVNHALTGDANISGDSGWWNRLVGPGKAIDTHRFAVISFNIPGNGVLGATLPNFKDYHTADIAYLFYQALDQLHIGNLYALVGGSIGGCIGWEFMAQFGNKVERFVPIATDWKSTDWLIANCYLQELILKNSKDPVYDARVHAMLCYRTPISFSHRFDRTINEDEGLYNVETWLRHHGNKLKNRFCLQSYLTVNHLLQSVNSERAGRSLTEIFAQSKTTFHLVSVDTDLFFTPEPIRATYQLLKENNNDVYYHEIQSLYGHDAFLIEYDQMEKILSPIFNKTNS